MVHPSHFQVVGMRVRPAYWAVWGPCLSQPSSRSGLLGARPGSQETASLPVSAHRSAEIPHSLPQLSGGDSKNPGRVRMASRSPKKDLWASRSKEDKSFRNKTASAHQSPHHTSGQMSGPPLPPFRVKSCTFLPSSPPKKAGSRSRFSRCHVIGGPGLAAGL